MNFVGKYTFTMPTPSGERESALLLRNYYDGNYHGVLTSSHGGTDVIKNVETEGNVLRFDAKAGPGNIHWTFTVGEDSSIEGTAMIAQSDGQTIEAKTKGVKTDITPEDDKASQIEMKKKALIIYSSITGNTAKVAEWFKETFEHYGMETTMIKLTNTMKWEQYEGKTHFEDYDVVCLGSLIIAGAPTSKMVKTFSLGGGTSLENNVTKNAEAGKGFNDGGVGFVPGGPGGPDGGPGGPGGPGGGPGGPIGDRPSWHANDYTAGHVTYPGGPAPRGLYNPLGIVFTTYGGGFSGSNEALATLETLKLYLDLANVKVVGKFACCGKEFGPAGLEDGAVPHGPGGSPETPVYYKDGDGNYHAGSYFFHTHMSSKPGPRDEAKAKALIADLVEDYFYSHDGKRKETGSQYISIS